MNRCLILLKLDEEQGMGLTHAQLTRYYIVCPATITNIVQSYVKNGITDIIRYNISPNSSVVLRKVTGVLRHISSKWPAAQRPKDTSAGHSGSWKGKPILSRMFR